MTTRSQLLILVGLLAAGPVGFAWMTRDASRAAAPDPSVAAGSGPATPTTTAPPQPSAALEGFEVASARLELVPAPAASARTQLDPAAALGALPRGSLGLVVRDPLGRPLEGATVFLRRAKEQDAEPLLSWSQPRLYKKSSREGRTDADGVCVFEDVAPGRYRSGAWAWQHRLYETPTFEFEASGPGLAFALALEPAPADRLVSGRIVDPFDPEASAAHALQVTRVDGLLQRTFLPRRGDEFYLVASGAEHGDTVQVAAGNAQLAPYRYALAVGVRGGTNDLVMELARPRELALDVRDEQGRAVPRWTAVATIERCGAWLPVYEPDALGRGFPFVQREGRISLPCEPFRLRVTAPAMRDVELGPFLAAELGERLEIALGTLPVVAGRVMAAGAVVPGAEVRIVEPEPTQPALYQTQRTTTDEDGWFSVPTGQAGTFCARVTSSLGWQYTSAPFELDGQRDLTGLILDLGSSAGIRGRLHLPDEESPEHWFVVFHRGGDVLSAPHVRVDAQGHFRSPALAPAAWSVFATRGTPALRPFAADATESFELDSIGAWAVNCTPVRVDLAAGDEVELELHPLDEPAYRLHGKLEVREAPAPDEGIDWLMCGTGYSVRADTELFDGKELLSAATYQDGAFELGARRGGPVRLALTWEPAAGAVLRIEDQLELAAPETRWDLSLVLGTLDLPHAHESECPYASARFEAELPSGARVRSQLQHDEREDVHSFRGRLPAGTGRVTLVDRATQAERELAVSILPERDVTVELP